HSHALTVLYYEVLRHFRFVVEAAGRQPAVFWRPPVDLLSDQNIRQTILERGATLKAALLDSQLAGAFDAAAHIAQREAAAKHAPPAPGAPAPIQLRYFAIEVTAKVTQGGGQYQAGLRGRLQLAPNSPTVQLVNTTGGPELNNQTGSYRGG